MKKIVVAMFLMMVLPALVFVTNGSFEMRTTISSLPNDPFSIFASDPAFAEDLDGDGASDDFHPQINFDAISYNTTTQGASFPALIGVQFGGEVVRIDGACGAGRVIGFSGFRFLQSLATNSSGVLFSTQQAGFNSALITIDPDTGEGTQVATLSFGAVMPAVRALAFSPSDELLAINNTGPAGGLNPDDLFIIDAGNGVGTFIGFTGFTGIQGLAFSPTGTLYAWDIGIGLLTIDPTDGAATDVNPAVPGTSVIQSIAFSPDGRPFGAGQALFEIDPSNGEFFLVGSGAYSDLRGIEVIGLGPGCDPRPLTQGYWHRQCLGAGLITQEPLEPEFEKVLVPAVDARLAETVFVFDTCREGMDAVPPSDPCERALKQYTSLLLNIASERLQTLCCRIDLAGQQCGASSCAKACVPSGDSCGSDADCPKFCFDGSPCAVDGDCPGICSFTGEPCISNDDCPFAEFGETCEPGVCSPEACEGTCVDPLNLLPNDIGCELDADCPDDLQLADVVDGLAALVNSQDPDLCRLASDCAGAVNEDEGFVFPAEAVSPLVSKAAEAEFGDIELDHRKTRMPTAILIEEQNAWEASEKSYVEVERTENQENIDHDLAVLANGSAPEMARKVSENALLTALGGGYEPEKRLEIVRALLGKVDIALYSLLAKHLEDIRSEAQELSKDDLVKEAERLLKKLEPSKK